MTPPDGYLGILTHASRMVSYHGALVSNGWVDTISIFANQR